jgi:hypothetical protein
LGYTVVLVTPYSNSTGTISLGCYQMIREILVKRFLLTFPLTRREILREKFREIS